MRQPLLGGCTLHCSHVSWYAVNVQFEASKQGVKNGNNGRAVDPWYVTLHQHEDKSAYQGRESTYDIFMLLVHMAATYDAFQAVLGFLCH